jgi:L-asparaginase / beta-aspartyl-peptidase
VRVLEAAFSRAPRGFESGKKDSMKSEILQTAQLCSNCVDASDRRATYKTLQFIARIASGTAMLLNIQNPLTSLSRVRRRWLIARSRIFDSKLYQAEYPESGVEGLDGSFLNADSIVKCDASIMDGRTLDAGAIAGVRGVRNPVLLARAVMEKSEHVFLIGEGAERFAREHGTSFEDAEYFLTEARIAQLAEAEKKLATVLDHSQTNERKLGTVGAVARDRSSNLAATTSTGGLVNQHWGRVGDSAIIGAGVFADNASCAVSCTGIGEHLLRTSLAKTAALFIEYRGVRADEAADAAIRYLVDKVHGLDGLIIVDRDGTCARANSPPGMLTGTAENGEVRIQTT